MWERIIAMVVMELVKEYLAKNDTEPIVSSIIKHNGDIKKVVEENEKGIAKAIVGFIKGLGK